MTITRAGTISILQTIYTVSAPLRENMVTSILGSNELQSTPDNLNLQGEQNKVRVIGSSSYRG